MEVCVKFSIHSILFICKVTTGDILVPNFNRMWQIFLVIVCKFEVKDKVEIRQHSPIYTDHDALCISLKNDK